MRATGRNGYLRSTRRCFDTIKLSAEINLIYFEGKRFPWETVSERISNATSGRANRRRTLDFRGGTALFPLVKIINCRITFT